ncbi:MAG: DMT family transporter [Proteobacteria bacterium]|nr:MAG: DMT family transporter [Pseudomonadota bacterium]
MSDQRKAYVYALLAVGCWGTVAAAFKLSLRHVGSDALVLYSAAAALTFLFCVAMFTNTLSEVRRWRTGDYARSALLGALNPFLYYVVLFKAYDLLPAQEAQPLNFTWPVVLVVLSAILFRQPIRPVSYLALGVSFLGVVMIATHGNPFSFRLSDPLGVTLALASTIVWALYWLYSSNDRREPVNRLLMNFAFGFVLVLGYCVSADRLEPVGWRGLAGSVYIGLVEMGLAFVFWLKALRLSRTTAEVGNLIYLTPFLSLVVISLVVGEEILPATWAGLVLIVAGIIVQNRFGGTPRPVKRK